MAEGDVTAPVDPLAGKATGSESSLSNWAGPYVTEMLGKGAALADEGYNAYMGPLTAGPSGLETAAFEGVGSLTLPTDQMGTSGYEQQQFTGDMALSNGVATRNVKPIHITMLPDVLTQAQNPTLSMVNRKNSLAASLGVDQPR